MLPGQQRRRHNQRHLGSRRRHTESRPQSHLGLAEAHISANQTIHRNPRSQIRHHIRYGMQLVISLGIRKFRTKLVIQPLRRHKTFCFLQLPLGRNLNQPGRDVFYFLFYAGFLRLPGRSAQNIQLPPFVFRTITGKHLNIFHRHKKLGIIGIKNFQTIMRRPAGRNVFQPQKTPHPVLDMNHQLANIQRTYIGNKIFRRHLACRFAVLTLAQYILFGNQTPAFAALHLGSASKSPAQVHHHQHHLFM